MFPPHGYQNQQQQQQRAAPPPSPNTPHSVGLGALESSMQNMHLSRPDHGQTPHPHPVNSYQPQPHPPQGPHAPPSLQPAPQSYYQENGYPTQQQQENPNPPLATPSPPPYTPYTPYPTNNHVHTPSARHDQRPPVSGPSYPPQPLYQAHNTHGREGYPPATRMNETVQTAGDRHMGLGVAGRPPPPQMGYAMPATQAGPGVYSDQVGPQYRGNAMGDFQNQQNSMGQGGLHSGVGVSHGVQGYSQPPPEGRYSQPTGNHHPGAVRHAHSYSVPPMQNAGSGAMQNSVQMSMEQSLQNERAGHERAGVDGVGEILGEGGKPEDVDVAAGELAAELMKLTKTEQDSRLLRCFEIFGQEAMITALVEEFGKDRVKRAADAVKSSVTVQRATA